MPVAGDALTRACQTLLQRTVASVDYPGGRSRESLRMVLDGGDTIIATRRNEAQLAAVEARTLRAQRPQGTCAHLAGDRRRPHPAAGRAARRAPSLALRDADEGHAERLLSSALTGLYLAQRARAPKGWSATCRPGYRRSLAKGALRPAAAHWCGYLGIPAPDLDRNALLGLLGVPEPRFVKWDARPGNAYVVDGTVFWFDWEHAGKRNALDDMAWLLGDEFVPEYPEMELRLIDAFVGKFADSGAAQTARNTSMPTAPSTWSSGWH